MHGVFTTRGAVLKSWQLKKYHDANNQPLELVAGHAPADSALPFTLATDDPALSAKLATAVFTVTGGTPTPAGGWEARFEYTDGAGIHAEKRFSIAPDHPYVINVSASITRNGEALPVTIDWGPALGSGITVKSRTYNPPPQALYYRDGKVTRIAPAKIAAAPDVDGTFGFVGVDDHYFIAVAIKPPPLHVHYAVVDVALPDHPEGAHYVDWAARFPAPPQSAAYFAGPKDFDVLASVDRDLVRSIDFGMFAWLVVPLLRALKWLNGYIGNYGWSLIALTVLINLAMFPLRHKSVVSMRKMQEIQPEVKAIQDRYKGLKVTDPARTKMNEEMMDAVQAAGREPRQRVRADAPDDARALRVLLDALGRDRAARRALHRPDSRPVGARSALHLAGPDGRHDVRPAEDDAVDRGSDPAEDDDVHAARDGRDVPVGGQRPGDLLDREQRLGHRPADDHEPAHRTARAADRPASGRAPDEER